MEAALELFHVLTLRLLPFALCMLSVTLSVFSSSCAEARPTIPRKLTSSEASKAANRRFHC